MPMRPLVLALCASATILGPPARAREWPGPLCADAGVLQMVQERLSRAGQPAWLEPATAGQIPVGPGRINCAVRVHRIVVDTARSGNRPLDLVSEYRFALQLGRNAIFVLSKD